MWLWYAGYSHRLRSKGELSWHQKHTCLMSRQTTVYTNQIFTWPCALFLMFCTEGDIARDVANICFIGFMVWSLKREGKGILNLKGISSIFFLLVSIKTCLRWNTHVGWKSSVGSEWPHFSSCSPNPETWHQFLLAESLHCFLFQNPFVYPVLFVYTRIEWIIFNEHCPSGISAPFLFANCLGTNCRGSNG